MNPPPRRCYGMRTKWPVLSDHPIGAVESAGYLASERGSNPVFSVSLPLCSFVFPVVKSFEVVRMNLLVLGRGKTGSQVAEVAAERKHHLQVASSRDNLNGAAVDPERLRGIDVVLDFTAPHCVLQNIEACVKAGKNMVVGTTGWYKA